MENSSISKPSLDSFNHLINLWQLPKLPNSIPERTPVSLNRIWTRPELVPHSSCRMYRTLRACVGSSARPRTPLSSGSPWATTARPSWRTRSSTTPRSPPTLGKRQQVGMKAEEDIQVCRVSTAQASTALEPWEEKYWNCPIVVQLNIELFVLLFHMWQKTET